MSVVEAEIIQIIRYQQEAWNRADAAGYTRDCDENMTFTNIVGKIFFGREAFERTHASIFDTLFKGSILRMDIQRIYSPAPGVAIVDIACQLGEYQTLPPGVMPRADGLLHTCLLEVLVRSEAGWRVAAYHNVDIKS